MLVVAEDDATQASVVRALRREFANAQIIEAATRQELATSLTADNLALVVTGHRLGWGNGPQVIRDVRQRRPRLPIVMVSAHANDEVVADAFKAGVTDYLPLRRLDRLGAVARHLAGQTETLAPVVIPIEQEFCVATLIETVRAILRERDFKRASRLVLESCKEVIGAEAGYIGLLSESGDAVDVICVDELPYSCELEGGLQMRVCGARGEALRQRKVVYTNDARRTGWWDLAPEDLSLEQVLCVPLIFDEDAIGFLELANNPRGFSNTDALIATLFAELVVFSLQHIRVGDTLLRRESQFSRFAQSSPGGIFLTDVKGRIVLWNRGKEAITGVPAHQALGKRIWDPTVFAPPVRYSDDKGQQDLREQLQRGLTTGKLPNELELGEQVIQGKDGSERHLRYRLFPVPVENGFGLGGIASDVTEEIRAQRQIEHLAEILQEEREVLSAIMENTRAHLAYLDPNFRFVHVNAAYVDSSGYTVDELIGRNHFDLYPDAENQAIFERVRETGKPFTVRAKPFVFPNQPERGVTYWDWTLVPVKSASGSVKGLVLSLMDVTEQEVAARDREAHLRRMRRLLEVSEQVLAEQTLKGLLEQVVDAARRLTGARLGFAVHGHGDAPYLVVTSDAHGTSSRLRRPPLAVIMAARSEYDEGSSRLSLTDEEVRTYLAQWGIPQVPTEALQLLGARLIGQGDQSCATIIVSGTSPDGFSESDEALVAQMAALASLGLRHIEARHEADRRVAELDATISSIADGIVIYDEAGRVVRMNTAAQRIIDRGEGLHFGIPSQTAKDGERAREGGQNGRKWIGELPVTRALQGETMPGFITKLEPSRELASSDAAEDGPVWLSTSAAPIRGPDRHLVGAVSVFTDITELRTVQERLEHANQHLARQTNQLQDRNQQLQLLNAVGRELSGTLELTEVLDRLLVAIGDVISVDQAAVWLVDREHSEWLVRSAVMPRAAFGSTVRTRVLLDTLIASQTEGSPGRAGVWQEEQAILSHSGDKDRTLRVPLRARGKLIGVLEIIGREWDATSEEHDTLTTLAAWAAIAIENAMLHREAQQAAVVAERTRLASDLHDAVSQLLFSAKVTAESLLRLWEVNPEAVPGGLAQLQELTRGALAEMRTLLLELRPTALTDGDLGELLGQLTEAMSSRGRMSVSLELEGTGPLPGDVQVALYRMAQETLNNVVKHARAKHTQVYLRRLEDRVELVVEDDGKGFDPSCVPVGCLGLQILHERAATIGAQLDIQSAIDEGTRVSVRWPRGQREER